MEDPASRPVTRSARCGRERPRVVRVARRLPPASSGLAGDADPGAEREVTAALATPGGDLERDCLSAVAAATL